MSNCHDKFWCVTWKRLINQYVFWDVIKFNLSRYFISSILDWIYIVSKFQLIYYISHLYDLKRILLFLAIKLKLSKSIVWRIKESTLNSHIQYLSSETLKYEPDFNADKLFREINYYSF